MKRRARVLAAGAVIAGATGLVLLPADALTFTNSAAINLPAPGPGVPGPTPGSVYPSNVVVSGLSGTVTDVNVTLNGMDCSAHTQDGAYPEDVDIMLVGPTGSNAVIYSDVGGSNVDAPPLQFGPITITLDDQAANPLPADSRLSAGTYRPVDDDDDVAEQPNSQGIDTFPAPAPAPAANTALATFNGTAPNGTWSLYVVDDFPGTDNCRIAGGWTLDLLTAGASTTTGPMPTTVTSTTLPSTTTTRGVTTTTTTLPSTTTTRGVTTTVAPGAAHMTMAKSPSSTSGAAPLAVTYTYTLANDGSQVIFHTAVSDDRCASVTFQSGDADNDQLLDPGETWTFRCAQTLTSTTTNTAVASGTSSQTGLGVASNAAQATVTVTGGSGPPAGGGLRLAKSASTTSGAAPLAVTYTYTLANDGTEVVFGTAVKDDRCASVTLRSGDVDNDQLLDPGETWTFRCSQTLTASTTNRAVGLGSSTQTGLPVISNLVQATVTVS